MSFAQCQDSADLMGSCVAVQLSPSEVMVNPLDALKADSGACLDAPSEVHSPLPSVAHIEVPMNCIVSLCVINPPNLAISQTDRPHCICTTGGYQFPNVINVR